MTDAPIIKVQISLNDGGATALSYNQDRSICQEFPATDAIRDAVGPTGKGYFRWHLIDREIVLVERVEDQQW